MTEKGTMTFTIDLNSPERAWLPFLNWLTSQGINPTDTTAITINPDTMAADVTLLKRRHGEHYLLGDELAKTSKHVELTSLPPRKTMRAQT